MEELEGVLRLLLGASVQVSGGREGYGPALAAEVGDSGSASSPLPRSVSTGNSSSDTSRASASTSRVSWLPPSRRYTFGLALPCRDTLSPTSLAELLSLRLQVTQPGTGMVLALAGPDPGELAPPELEMLSRSLMGTLLRLVRERDVGAQVRRGRWRSKDGGGIQMCVGDGGGGPGVRLGL